MSGPCVDQLPLGELRSDPSRVLGTRASDATLHYCSPVHGGWGVVRTALLVPESYLLFVCPAACGRHGAIAAIEQGYKDRVGYLCISDEEIALGRYEEEIAKGVDAVVALKKPRALMVCVSCIDDLLGTDHDAAVADFEARHGIPVRLARMNPIALDGKLPPGQRIQRTLHEFLPPAEVRDGGVNLLGCFQDIDPAGDLARLAAACGLGPLRHPASCATFDEFSLMARSSAALLVRPEGKAAAAYYRDELGTPVLEAPVAYSARRVREGLEAFAAFALGISGAAAPDLDAVLGAEREAAEAAAADAADALSGARVAVDSTATASPFDLALALAEAGVRVERVYAEKLAAHDKPSFDALAELAPGILVCNPSHARRHAGRPSKPQADLAVGFQAAYAASAPRTCPLAFDEGLYGYRGRRVLFESLRAAALSAVDDLEEQVRAYGLVV